MGENQLETKIGNDMDIGRFSHPQPQPKSAHITHELCQNLRGFYLRGPYIQQGL